MHQSASGCPSPCNSLRNWPGVIPVSEIKARRKADRLLNPLSLTAASTVQSGYASSPLA